MCKRTLAGEEVKYLVLIFFKRFSLPFRWKARRTKLVIRMMATTDPMTAMALDLGVWNWEVWNWVGTGGHLGVKLEDYFHF